MTSWLEKFEVDNVSAAGGWTDVNIIDSSPNSLMRWWRISQNDSGEIYGALLRAEDVSSPFDFRVELPTRMVDIFAMWLRMQGVIR